MGDAASAGALEIMTVATSLMTSLSPLYGIPLAIAAVSMLTVAVIRAVKG